MNTPWWMWSAFAVIVLILLILDLGILHRKDKPIGVKHSLYLSLFYILAGLAFGLWIWHYLGVEKMGLYYTGFLVEKSLSLDNLFVISVIFKYFAVPRQYQYRVLFWGILGVVVLRGVMILLGAALVSEFSWMLYVFSVFLFFIGIKMLFVKETETDVSQNPLLKYLKKHWRITPDFRGRKFFTAEPHPVTKKKVLWVTPLFIVLLLIDVADTIFAIDSIPAIFAITTDPYIVFTSNIFAVLGLRALYFALDAVMERFVYLQYALGLILVFIGGKIFIKDLFGWHEFPAWISLTVTVVLLMGGIIVSLFSTRNKKMMIS